MATSEVRRPDRTPTGVSSPRSVWDLLIITVVLSFVAGIVVFTVDHYPQVQDVGTVLGIVLPGVVSLGAAVFGITVAYNAGSTRGETRGAAGKQQAIAETRKSVANQLAPRLEKVEQTLGPNILDRLETDFVSPSGTRSYQAPEPMAELTFGSADVSATREALAELRASLETLQES
jgi:hypothetical protein